MKSTFGKQYFMISKSNVSIILGLSFSDLL